MTAPPVAEATHSTEERLALGWRPKPNDVVVEAMEVLAEDGIVMGFKAVDKMMRRMWADESAAERKRERLIDYQGTLHKGQYRTYADDPVGEEASELADYIRGWRVER